MKYDLTNQIEADAAFEYLTKLVGKEAVAEVKRVSPSRSLAQNNYLHLLLGAFGIHFGYTIAEAKLVYKDLNKDIYKYKHPKGRWFFRSSADLSVDEMTKSIDRFREASEKQGCLLPTATDQDWLRAIENDIEQHYKYT